MQNDLSIHSSRSSSILPSAVTIILFLMFRPSDSRDEWNMLVLVRLYWGWIGTWKFLRQIGNCFYISICRTRRSYWLCWHWWQRGFQSREAHHLSLAVKNEDTFNTRLSRKGVANCFKRKETSVRFYYLESLLSSFLLGVLNDANVEGWANIRD